MSVLAKFLPHYSRLLKREDMANYLICKTLPIEFTEDEDIEILWDKHDLLSKQFKAIIRKRRAIGSGSGTFDKFNSDRFNPESHFKNFLDLKIVIADKMLESCEFCENLCNVNRILSQKGICGLDTETHLSSTFLHRGEEPPLVPSGTMFFSGCTFNCVFCQNSDISTFGKQKYIKASYASNLLKILFQKVQGRIVDAESIAKIANDLESKGAKNINYVGGDPTPNLHNILASLNYQKNNICQLWNSNFYNSTKAVNLLREVMDLWLPDLKYGNNICAKKYSGIERYWDVLTRNLIDIYDWGSRDIIIRHLVMPGHFDCCTKPILEWISKKIPEVTVNIMEQYHPDYLVNSENFSEINRRVTHAEMNQVYSLATKLGINYELVS